MKKKPDYITQKVKIKENSKLRKKIKTTLKKTNIDKQLLINTISAIKKLSKSCAFENLFLFVFLKNNNSDENSNENLKSLNSKMIKLPYTSKINKVCLVDDDLFNKKDFNQTDFLNYYEKLNLKELEIISTEEFVSKIKSKESLGNQHFNYLVPDKIKSKVFQMTNSSNLESLKMLYHSILFYDKNKNKKGIFEYLTKIIEILNFSTLLNVNLKNNFGLLKIGTTDMSLKDLYKNIKIVLIKTLSILLTACDKHSNYKCVVLKSENSMPFEILGKMTKDELKYFEN